MRSGAPPSPDADALSMTDDGILSGAVGRGRGLSLRDTNVAAYEVSLHRGCLLGQVLGLVRALGHVLAVTDRDRTGVAAAVGKALVQRIGPAATAAQA